MKEHPEWRAVGSASPPFQWIDETGRYFGLAADYDKILSGKTGLNVRAVPAPSWPDSLKQLEDHEVDVCTLLIATPERNKFLNFTDEVLSLPTVVLVRADNKEIQQMSDLKGK